MIHESFYWKYELYKYFIILANFRFLKKPIEQSFVRIEKAILFGGYIIRKLDEAQKIPPDFLTDRINIRKYKCKTYLIDHRNSHRVDSNYDLDNFVLEKRDYSFIINQIIHSFNLVYSFDESDRLDGIYVNSDKTKLASLYYLSLRDILFLFLKISEGDITSATLSREYLNNKNGRTSPGPSRLISAIYSYSLKESLDKIIERTMDGHVYKRSSE